MWQFKEVEFPNHLHLCLGLYSRFKNFDIELYK